MCFVNSIENYDSKIYASLQPKRMEKIINYKIVKLYSLVIFIYIRSAHVHTLKNNTPLRLAKIARRFAS